MTYGGAPVLSRRSDRRLQEVSKATGGVVVPLGLATVDLAPSTTPASPGPRPDSVRPRGRSARRAVPAVRARRPGVRAGRVGASWRSPWMASPAGRRGRDRRGRRGESEESAAAAVTSGREAYASGLPRGARRLRTGDCVRPRGAIPRYDAAATLYQLGRYADALTRYREARERAGPGLRTKIDYALGNTSLALGDVAEGAPSLRRLSRLDRPRCPLRRHPARRRDQPSVRRRTGSPPLDSTRGWRRPTPAVDHPRSSRTGGRSFPASSERDGVGPSPGAPRPVGRPDRSTGVPEGQGGRGLPHLDRARPRLGSRMH